MNAPGQPRSRNDQPDRTAWHVGRSGEVPCGMAQVINTYLDWPFERFRIRTIRSRSFDRRVEDWKYFAGALWKTARMAGPSENLVVGHLSFGGSFLREGSLLRLAKLRGFPVVAHLHGSDNDFGPFVERWPGLIRWVLSATDAVVVLNEETRRLVEELVPNVAVALVPNAVKGGAPSQKRKWVVFGGWVGLRKGVDLLLRAWHDVARESDWKLFIAGTVEPDFEPLLERGTFPISDNVTFTGPLLHDELLRLLDQSQVAVLPSRGEAMPMFILEALARDNCVLSTRVGGIPDVLGGERGILVEPDDLEALKEGLRTALFDPETRRAVAERGSEHFQLRYSASAVFGRLEEVWYDAMEGVAP